MLSPKPCPLAEADYRALLSPEMLAEGRAGVHQFQRAGGDISARSPASPAPVVQTRPPPASTAACWQLQASKRIGHRVSASSIRATADWSRPGAESAERHTGNFRGWITARDAPVADRSLLIKQPARISPLAFFRGAAEGLRSAAVEEGGRGAIA